MDEDADNILFKYIYDLNFNLIPSKCPNRSKAPVTRYDLIFLVYH
jgi:hypothetical protein